jgi:MSHA biogenesis protein MshQ
MMRTALRGLLMLGLLLSGAVQAATYSFGSGGFFTPSTPPPCLDGSWSRSGNTFTCTGSVALASGDSLVVSTAIFESLGNINVIANAGISLNNNTVGTSSKTISLSTTYGSFTSIGTNSITGSVQTASGAISLVGSTVAGAVVGGGTVSLTGGGVAGNVSSTGAVTTSGAVISGTLTATNGSVSLSGGSVTGLVTSGCCTVISNNTNLGGGARSNSGAIQVTGGTIQGPFYAANNTAIFSAVTMSSGSVSGASTIVFSNSTVGSASATVNMTSVSGAVTLNSTTVFGDLTAPSYSTIMVNSPSRVYGTCLPNSTPANACLSNPAPVCFNDNFNRTSLGADWATTTSGGSFGLPVTVNNRMRLTDNTGNVATAATLQRLLPAAGNYVQVQFKHYAYNGSGADGMGVILSDASVAPLAGSYGGPLGYGTRGNTANPGFAGGWLGVGIDEYGNFSAEGGTGGPGQRVDSVAVRGSGSVDRISGYQYIAGTAANLNPGIDLAGSTAGPGHTYRITVDGRIAGKALLTVERNTGAGFSVLTGINGVDVLAASGQAGLPQNFYLSLTGSSGGATNIHELDDIQVCATVLNPIGLQIDHFEFSYSGSALTCSPQPVTVKACLNSSCSSLYTDPVSVTLVPSAGWTASAPASVSGGNILSFSGGTATAQLRSNTLGDVVVGMSTSTPTTKPLTVSVCSTSGCEINYAASGFLLSVPNVLAAKPTAATIQAVKQADNSQSCAPGFASGSRSVAFTRSYSNPNTGTQSVTVNGTPVTTVTPVTLNFDATATAPLTVQYNDAGEMALAAKYAPTSGLENGLDLYGSDLFVSRPYGLLLQTDTSSSCTLADISCPLYPGSVRAGDGFNLKIKAVAWQSDGEPLTAAALADNLVTPNFQLSNIALSSQLLAPAGGSAGTLGVGSYSHVLGTVANSNSTTVSQSVSEVGVFTLTATPPVAGYFGETVSASVSGLVGRFAPAYLTASGSASLTPSCGAAFSYQGQPMAFAVGQEPLLTVTGKNRSGGVTSNYDRGSFWQLGTPTRDAYLSVTTKASLDALGRLSSSAAVTPVQSGADTGDGARSYRWSGETLQYSPAVVPLADDLPFTAAVRQGFSAAALTDADSVCNGVGTGCVAFNYDFANVPGSQVRLGRLRLSNAHGSELQGLALPFNLETWQAVAGASFQAELTDSCTNASVLGTPELSSHTGNLAVGETVATVSGPLAAAGQVQLSAPGAGNDGSVQARFASQPTWLDYDWDATGLASGRRAASALATFGIYRGATPLIFRRELYRTP